MNTARILLALAVLTAGGAYVYGPSHFASLLAAWAIVLLLASAVTYHYRRGDLWRRPYAWQTRTGRFVRRVPFGAVLIIAGVVVMGVIYGTTP